MSEARPNYAPAPTAASRCCDYGRAGSSIPFRSRLALGTQPLPRAALPQALPEKKYPCKALQNSRHTPIRSRYVLEAQPLAPHSALRIPHWKYPCKALPHPCHTLAPQGSAEPALEWPGDLRRGILAVTIACREAAQPPVGQKIARLGKPIAARPEQTRGGLHAHHLSPGGPGGTVELDASRSCPHSPMPQGICPAKLRSFVSFACRPARHGQRSMKPRMMFNHLQAPILARPLKNGWRSSEARL
jgi:hypothetical protein